MMDITLMWSEDDQRIIKTIQLSRLIAIGRSPVCEVVLKQPTISRQHLFVYAFGLHVYV